MKNHENKLRFAIKGNALFSLSSGIAGIIFSNSLMEIMDVKHTSVFIFIGVGLLLFSISLAFNAYKKLINIRQVRYIIYQDWAWVLGSIILLILNPYNISEIGTVIVFIIAVIVAIFALLQNRYLQNYIKNKEGL